MKALAITSLTLTDEQEQELYNVCEEGANAARKGQGQEAEWDCTKQPKQYSWLWWRWISELAFEGDFSWRVGLTPRGAITTGVEGLKVFSNSNLSMNTPADHHAQLRVKISRSLLKDHRFFGAKPEGNEDQHAAQAIEQIQRWLRHRSKKSGFRDQMETSVNRSLLSGEQVLLPTYAQRIVYKPILARVVLDQNGRPLQSEATKTIVTELDPWDEVEGGRSQLRKDPTITRATGSELKYSAKPMKLMQADAINDGARFDRIHPMDFICDPRWATLDEADYKGNEFSMPLDDIKAMLESKGQLIPEAWEEYREKVKTGSKKLARKDQAKESIGEVDEDSIDASSGAGSRSSSEDMQPRILLRQQFVKADTLKLGHRQDIWVITDNETGIPLIYDFASEIVEVDPDKGHPYRCVRGEEVIDRWYGRPIYQRMWDDLIAIDSRLNQIQLECDAAGNIIFVNGKFIVGWNKEKRLEIRSRVPNEVTSGADPREAIHVETIQPQIQEIEASLDLALQRAQAKNGLSGAGQTVSKALPGTETATGQQILEDAQNAVLENLVKELAKGIDTCISDFTKIELDNIDEAELVKRLGPDNAKLVMSWVIANEGAYDSAIEILIAAIVDTTTLDKNSQAMAVGKEWIMWPPAYQPSWKPLFEKMLMSLDIDNPSQFLQTANELLTDQSTAPAAPMATTANAATMEPIGA
jgi:hypothetical protein